MSGAVVASRVRVQQHGDAMIGERVDRVYDERTGMIGEKKTTVATVPLQGGGTAVLVGEQITAAQVHPVCLIYAQFLNVKSQVLKPKLITPCALAQQGVE